MTDLAAARNNGDARLSPYDMLHEFAVLAGATIYAGSGVAIGSAGTLVHASAVGALFTLGRAEKTIVAAAAGDKLKVRQGIVYFANDAGHLLTIANRLGPCYWTDDQTVGTDSSKLLAGIVYDVDSSGVWVIMGPTIVLSTVAGGLLAANNLSDLALAATARTNLAFDVHTGIVTRRTSTIAGGAAYTVTSADGDCTIESATDNHVTSLPAVAAGNKGMRVTMQATGADGAAKMSMSPSAADKIFGGVNGGAGGALVTFGAVANKDIVLTKATALKGDYVTVRSDGSTGWYVVAGQGIFASEP